MSGRGRTFAFAAFFVAGSWSHAGAAAEEPLEWRWLPVTQSPWGEERTSDALVSELRLACGVSDAALDRVAQTLVLRKVRGLSYLDHDGLNYAQRAFGEPHPWPRAWIVSGKRLDPATTAKRLEAWSKSFGDPGERRCGIARGTLDDGTMVAAAIAVDAAADLLPFPTRARAGQWLTVEATLKIAATSARVVVMGPSGPPRGVPTSVTGKTVRARFAPDRSGSFTVQVLADLPSGPRPVLEAMVFAEVEPPKTTPNLAAPGEGEGTANGSEGDLLRMVNALRVSEGLPPLRRSARLDALALAHARAMRSKATVAHDVGNGDPAARVLEGNVPAKDVGENVANAQDLRLAHRALYASPSHRKNLLSTGFSTIGIGVVRDDAGGVWVCELFTN